METPNAQPPTKQLEIAGALQEKRYFKPTPEIPKLTDRMMRGQPRLQGKNKDDASKKVVRASILMGNISAKSDMERRER